MERGIQGRRAQKGRRAEAGARESDRVGCARVDVGWSEVDVTCDERNVSSVVICIIKR